jgi:CheY-like chemotaxis protein
MDSESWNCSSSVLVMLGESTHRQWEERMSDVQAMPSSADASKATILVVEDEVLVRMFISDVVRDEGYNVIEAINADEALAILRSPVKLDLVLTDMRMRGSMDGAGLVRVLRAEFPFMKVVMAAGQRPDDELCKLLDAFLPKPVMPFQLRSCLRAILPASAVGQAP